MKRILQRARSRRGRYWAIQITGAPLPLPHTLCSTRREARELLRERELGDLINPARVVPVVVAVLARSDVERATSLDALLLAATRNQLHRKTKP